MKTGDFRRCLQEALRTGDLLPVASELVRCASIVHHGDEIVTRLSTKAVHRHRKRPGRPRDPERDRSIARAVIYARFNARQLGWKVACDQAAAKEGLPPNIVRRHYRGKDGKIRTLVQQMMRPSAAPENLRGTSMDDFE